VNKLSEQDDNLAWGDEPVLTVPTASESNRRENRPKGIPADCCLLSLVFIPVMVRACGLHVCWRSVGRLAGRGTIRHGASRCYTRISPNWSPHIHTLHYPSQFSYLRFVSPLSAIIYLHLNSPPILQNKY